MRKGCFGGLLFREWYMAKNKVILYLAMIAGVFALCVLALLSFEYGNLALLDEQIKADIYAQIVPIVKLYPMIVAGFLCAAVGESAVFDAKKLWKCFSKSTPVSCYKIAGAKYTLMAIAAAAGLLLSLGFILGMNLVMKTPTQNDLPLSLVMFALMVLMSVILQLGAQATGSTDKAGIIMMAVFLVGVAGFAFLIKTKDFPTETTIAERITALLPDPATSAVIAAVVIVGSLAAGFVCSAMLYKRREK